MDASQKFVTTIPEPPLSTFFFANTKFAWVWFLLRIYVGWQWFSAGIEKLQSPLWVGSKAGVAIHGFLTASLGKAAGQHPDVQSWYAWFIVHIAIPNTVTFSYVVTCGEILVGIALILGLFTGIAAFFGSFMNMNYLFAGTLSINPLLFLCELLLILAWRIAGWYGFDRFLLPLIGTPWHKGEFFEKDGQVEVPLIHK